MVGCFAAGTVIVLTSNQAAVYTAWIVSASPTPPKNTQYYVAGTGLVPTDRHIDNPLKGAWK